MKSETLYNRLLCLDALLAFDGVIPSLPELQLKATNFLEQFNKSLISEGEDEQLSDDICHALCCYLDRRIACCLYADRIAWDRYSLTRYFYGYQNEEETLRDRLEPLLARAEGQIFHYASRLLLAAASSGNGQDLEKLRALYAPPPQNVERKQQEEEPQEVSQNVERKQQEEEPQRALKLVRFMLPFQLVLLSLSLIALWFLCNRYLEAL